MAEEEVEVLRSIYGDELVVERNLAENKSPIILSMKIRPMLSQSQCSMGIHAVIELSDQYPKISPKVYLRQQRGFDESSANVLQKSIQEYVDGSIDMPILYDIFQMIQKFVETEKNFPSTVCPVCLDGFSAETVAFCTSNCDHYIHQNCFICYVNYTNDEIKKELSEWPEDMKSRVDQVLKCPICRTPLSEQDLSTVGGSSITLDEAIVDKGKFEFNWKEWRAKLKKLQPIFERQKARGGLIDPEEERKRYLITDNMVFERQYVPESSQQKENAEAVQFVENLSSEPSYQFLDDQEYKSRRPYTLFQVRNRNMGFKGDSSKERFRKGRGGSVTFPRRSGHSEVLEEKTKSNVKW